MTKDHLFVGDYNKFLAKKISPKEIIEKINPNAYRLKLPSHIQIFDLFNIKHLIPYVGDSSFGDDDVTNSKVNFLHPVGNEASRKG